MTASHQPPAPDAQALRPFPSEAAFFRAVLALAIGGFSIGTGEFVIMGLLPEVARDIGTSIPQAGHVISAYALGVVLGAPALAVLCAGWGRRTLLIALMGVYALGNFASALAPGYLSLNLLRFFTGLPHGTYFGVAALVAAALAPPGRRARAVGLVMLGLTGATLVGVPIAATLGQLFGWRAAFVFVGLIAVAAMVCVQRWVPPLTASAGASPLRELQALRNGQVWLTLGIAAIGFGGMFSVFSYIKPTLTEVAGLPLAGVPFVLALFGLGMVGGNLVGSRLADWSLMRTIGGVLVWAMLVLGGFSLAAAALGQRGLLHLAGGDHRRHRPGVADPADGRGRRSADPGGGAESLGLQLRECAGERGWAGWRSNRGWAGRRPGGSGRCWPSRDSACSGRQWSRTGAGQPRFGCALTTAYRREAGVSAPAYFRASNSRCNRQKANNRPPMAMRVHHELRLPSNMISVWIIPSINTPNTVPIT